MPLGEFSRTNSERTPRQAFLDAKHGGAGEVGEHHPAISRVSGRLIYRYLGLKTNKHHWAPPILGMAGMDGVNFPHPPKMYKKQPLCRKMQKSF
jgi:hypothetical protein